MAKRGYCRFGQSILAIILIVVMMAPLSLPVFAASAVTEVEIVYDPSKVEASTYLSGATVSHDLQSAIISTGPQTSMMLASTSLVTSSYEDLLYSNELLHLGTYYYCFCVQPKNGYQWDKDRMPAVTVNGVAPNDMRWDRNTSPRWLYVYVKTTATNNHMVYNVKVTPSSQKIQQGTSYRFGFTMKADMPQNPPSLNVTWSLSGQESTGTTVSSDGTVTVASDETASAFTVRATSVDRPAVYGEATVEVTDYPVYIDSVAIEPQTAEVRRAGSLQFACTVVGTDDHDVTWAVRENQNTQTKIDKNGLLTVGLRETAETIYVDVTSNRDPSKSDTATVTILPPDYITEVAVTYDAEAFSLLTSMTGGAATSALRQAVNYDADPKADVFLGDTCLAVKSGTSYWQLFSSGENLDPNGEYYICIGLEEKSGYFWDPDNLPAATVNGEPADDIRWLTQAEMGRIAVYKRIYFDFLVDEVVLDKTELQIVAGKSETLTATVLPEDAENKELEWTSDNPKIAGVDNNGKVTGLKAGYTTVRATSVAEPSKAGTCRVLVMFKDVAKPSEYFFDPVYWAVERKITTGYTGKKEGYFGPNDECTRAQIVTFLWRANGSPVVDPEGLSFNDVESTDYFYKAVIWAASEGITTGYTDKNGNPTGYFGSNDECTRAQIVTFLWRAAGSPETDASGVPSFSDVKTKDYFYKAVLWAAKNGITTGYTDSHGNPTGKFGSNDVCTRGQVVTFLYRAYNLH